MAECPGSAAHAWATAACPFLAQLAEREGPQFAYAIADAPLRPAGPGGRGFRPLLPEEGLGLSFTLFHGPRGVVPLAGFDGRAQALAALAARPQEEQQQAQQQAATVASVVPLAGSSGSALPTRGPQAPALPLASMGMSFGGGPFGFGDFLRKQLRRQREGGAGSGSGGGGRPRPIRRAPGLPGSSGAPGGGGGAGPSRPARGPAASRADFGSSKPGGKPGAGGGGRGPPAPSGAGAGAASAASAAAEAAGGCPMRKWLGPLAGVVFDGFGRVQCPEPIVAARAALARTAPVRQLRPQALPLKLLAVAATAAAVNVPCGAWREHFEKFSFGWFVAVHATIPFVAMLRKAVVMPKGAILVTIAAAVAGQVLGSRLERARLAAEAEGRAARDAAAVQQRPAAAVPARRRAAATRPTAPVAAPPCPPDDIDGGGGGLQLQLSCAMASLTPRPPGAALQAGIGRLLGLPVTPLQV